MASVFEVPLDSQPQSFQIDLAGVQYSMSLNWRDAPQGGWFLDLSDASGNLLIGGIPLVTGADLLAQYAYLGIGGELWVQTDGDPAAVPTFDNLGSESHLYFVVA